MMLTSDGKLCGGVAQRDELVLAAVVIDDDVHDVGAQGDVVCPDSEGGGRAIRHHLPVLICEARRGKLSHEKGHIMGYMGLHAWVCIDWVSFTTAALSLAGMQDKCR